MNFTLSVLSPKPLKLKITNLINQSWLTSK